MFYAGRGIVWHAIVHERTIDESVPGHVRHSHRNLLRTHGKVRVRLWFDARLARAFGCRQVLCKYDRKGVSVTHGFTAVGSRPGGSRRFWAMLPLLYGFHSVLISCRLRWRAELQSLLPHRSTPPPHRDLRPQHRWYSRRCWRLIRRRPRWSKSSIYLTRFSNWWRRARSPTARVTSFSSPRRVGPCTQSSLRCGCLRALEDCIG